MSALSRSSSSRPCGTLRCVERCWPSAAQARRSDTPSSRRTCSMVLSFQQLSVAQFHGDRPLAIENDTIHERVLADSEIWSRSGFVEEGSCGGDARGLDPVHGPRADALVV